MKNKMKLLATCASRDALVLCVLYFIPLDHGSKHWHCIVNMFIVVCRSQSTILTSNSGDKSIKIDL